MAKKGTIVSWNPQKGWGYVQLTSEDGGEQLFLHFSDFIVPRNPERGTDFTGKKVEVGWIESGNGKYLRAKSVFVVEHFKLHEEMAGNGTQWRLCEVCGGLTPHVEHHKKFEAWAGHDIDGERTMFSSQAKTWYECVPCRRAKDAAALTAIETDFAEACRHRDQATVFYWPNPWHENRLEPVHVAEVDRLKNLSGPDTVRVTVSYIETENIAVMGPWDKIREKLSDSKE